jgi:multicomponent Na+:H+ antiporter subunit C
MSILPYLVAAWLFVVGIYGVVTSRNLIHLVVCLGIMQTATYVLLAAIGYREGAGPPVFFDRPQDTPVVDSVSHALILVDVVVEATVVGVLLALVMQVYERKGTLDPDEIEVMRG